LSISQGSFEVNLTNYASASDDKVRRAPRDCEMFARRRDLTSVGHLNRSIDTVTCEGTDLPKVRIGSVYVTAMSEEDDPLARNGNWHRLSISFDDPRAMEQMGPNLEVSIAAVTEQGTTLAHHEVGALIDTGSKSSCISPRLASKMDGGLRGVRSLSHIYGLLEGPPTIRGLVRFKNGVEFIRDFSVLDQLAPYDVLIGRDILREGRMYIDGGTGHFRLYFPDRTA
jgi:hypothetical protein